MSTLLLAHILIYVAAVLGASAALPQIVKILRTKDAKAISYGFLMIRLIAFVLFMVAIILTGHLFMAISYVIIIVANLVILVLKLKFG